MINDKKLNQNDPHTDNFDPHTDQSDPDKNFCLQCTNKHSISLEDRMILLILQIFKTFHKPKKFRQNVLEYLNV